MQQCGMTRLNPAFESPFHTIQTRVREFNLVAGWVGRLVGWMAVHALVRCFR